MHVRYSTKHRNGKTYRYAQLVQSYRRPDGMPVHRVLANLSHLSELEIDNIRAALVASRKGKKVIPVIRVPASAPNKPLANRRFLDVAVLDSVWRQWGLHEVLDELLPVGDAKVPASSVVEALVVQRCVAPGSKLWAERWFPQTALPELLGVSPSHFNNSRVHRVLDALEKCEAELMARLPVRYLEGHGPWSALFLDVTDTWFVGHGPTLAQRTKTKQGHVKRKVGIVLLCNDPGYPLRWQVVCGRESDKDSMTRMARSVAALDWVGDVPFVCDRSMGNSAQLEALLAAGLRFVTALVVTEIDAYTAKIPHQAFADVPVDDDGHDDERLEQLGTLAEQTGMQRIDGTHYVLDLGVVERGAVDVESIAAADRTTDTDPVIAALRLGVRVRDAVDAGAAPNTTAAGRTLGLAKTLALRYRRLADLAPEIQDAVLQGRVAGVSMTRLLEIVALGDLDAQRAAFARILSDNPTRRPRRPRKTQRADSPRDEPVRVRAVVSFNPEVFLGQRRAALHRLANIRTFARRLNERLASSRSRLTRPKVLALVDNELRKHGLIEAFDVEVSTVPHGQSSRLVLSLNLREKTWQHRRRFDGFSLLVAHPEIEASAAELSCFYRAKDVVEKDFQTIKSFVKLRPVHHRRDEKVRAHVTVCMLALLLERTLDHMLGPKRSAASVLEELATCYLNQFVDDNSSVYSLTQLTDSQAEILRALKLEALADDEAIIHRLHPR